MDKVNNLKITSQFYFCPYSLSFDVYRGCPHACLYCFSLSQYFNNFSMKNKPFAEVSGKLDLNFLEKLLSEPIETGTNTHNKVYKLLVKEKQPFHIGGMYDPFPKGVEETELHGKKVLELLNKYQYPAIISTKNPPVEYKELFKEGKYILQVSLISTDDVVSRKIESNPPLPSERLKAMKILKPYVKKLVVRLQPFIPELFKTDEDIKNYLKVIKEHGADAVTVEFIKRSRFKTEGVENQFRYLDKNSELPISENLNKYGKVSGSDLQYPYAYKLKILKKIKEFAHNLGLEFYSAENECRALGDGYACCGVNQEKDKGFESKMSCFNEALFIAKKKGTVKWSDIKKKDYMKPKCILDMWNTQNRQYRLAHINYNIEDFLYESWNNKTPTNPCVFFKGLCPLKEGEEIIYKYTEL